MADKFAPYYKWLGIPPKDQPPHHYRLLGIELFETDRDVIDAAANRLMGYLKELAAGDDAAYSQKLLNEISRARLCLLNAEKKAAYDRELKAKLQAEEESTATQPPPSPFSFPPLAEPPAFGVLPQIDIASAAPRLDTRVKPPSLKLRAASASTAHAGREEGDSDREAPSAEEPDRPLGTRRSSPKAWYVAATAVAAVVAAAVVAFMLLRQVPLDDNVAETPRGSSEAHMPSALPVLTLVLTNEERREITAFYVDDQAQPLPPSAEMNVEPGRHHIILRRAGFEEVFDRITLVRGMRREYRPRWRRELVKPPADSATGAAASLPPLVPETKPLPTLVPETKPLPEMPPAGDAPKPEPEAPATPGPTPPADAEIQEAAANGFSSGFGRMVAAWLFNGDGSDSSGARHDGIAFSSSGDPNYVEGRVGTALELAPGVRFDAADPLLNNASEFSITLWLKLASLPTGGEPLLNGETTAVFVQGGFPRVEIGGRKPLEGPDTDPATGGFRGIDLSSHVGAWVHLGFVYAARFRQVHYYLNGERRGCQQFADPASAAWNRTVITGWAGVLDEVRVFNYRLGNSDVKAVWEGSFVPPSMRPRTANGALVCETWYDVAPASSRRDVENLLRNQPDATNVIEGGLSYLAPVGAGDRLDRIRGFLFPPAGGDYTFLLHGSGRAVLYLQRSGPLEDTLQELVANQPDQAATSPRIPLDANRPCYFEILHFYKGDAGGSLRLGWRLPGSAERLEAIPAAHFGSYRGVPRPPAGAAPQP